MEGIIQEPKVKKAKEPKLPKEPKQPKEKLPTRTRTEGVIDSWKDPAVAESRKQRSSVIVAGVQYKSVAEAFKALDLPMNRHIAFRASLKKEGTKTFEQGEGLPSYEFVSAPPVKAEPKPKKEKKAKDKPEAEAPSEVAPESSEPESGEQPEAAV